MPKLTPRTMGERGKSTKERSYVALSEAVTLCYWKRKGEVTPTRYDTCNFVILKGVGPVRRGDTTGGCLKYWRENDTTREQGERNEGKNSNNLS